MKCEECGEGCDGGLRSKGEVTAEEEDEEGKADAAKVPVECLDGDGVKGARSSSRRAVVKSSLWFLRSRCSRHQGEYWRCNQAAWSCAWVSELDKDIVCN